MYYDVRSKNINFCKVVKMVSVLYDYLWYCFTIHLYKYVSNIRQEQHSKQLGFVLMEFREKGKLGSRVGRGPFFFPLY